MEKCDVCGQSCRRVVILEYRSDYPYDFSFNPIEKYEPPTVKEELTCFNCLPHEIKNLFPRGFERYRERVILPLDGVNNDFIKRYTERAEEIISYHIETIKKLEAEIKKLKEAINYD